MQRENFINVETDFINAEKYIWLLWNLNMKKHSELAFKFRKHDFTRCFMRKQWTIFLNSEQKIILCKIVEIVYTENNEQFLWENDEQF